MTEFASTARRMTFAFRFAGVWRGVERAAAASAAWARAERHAFFAPPTAGAFHGETPPGDAYLSQLRSTWGRP